MATDTGTGGRLQIAVVGPTHPYKGGVAAHTTELARRFDLAGHDCLLVSWSRLYPRLLYPGEQTVADAGPDLPPYPRTVRSLRWDRPGTWWRTGARLRSHDVVVVVAVVPIQVPALVTVIRAVRAGPVGPRPRIVVLAHNVIPHETHPGDTWLMSRLLLAADSVLVHSADLAHQAVRLGARRVLVADLPPHLPGGAPGSVGQPGAGQPGAGQPGVGQPGPTRVLALGMVRSYKGFDLLLEAAAQVPDIQVTVAGEQWGRAGERVRELADDPRLAGRVRLERGYVPGERIGPLLAAHDVLALPYRHATASQNVVLGHAHGLPVLVTSAGTLADGVRDGVDGLVVPPGDVGALAAALRELAGAERLAALRRGVPVVDSDEPWRCYLQTVLHDPDLDAPNLGPPNLGPPDLGPPDLGPPSLDDRAPAARRWRERT